MVNNALTKKEGKSTFSVFLTQDAVKAKINEVVGGKDGQSFMTAILSAVTNNPDLQRCDQMSILNAAFLGQTLKLSPSPQLGQYYMVPFENKKLGVTVAQFQLGYKGYIQLAMRSGYYKKINVLPIKEGELIKYDPLNEELEVKLIEDDEERENTPTTGYFAMFEYQNGFRKTLYWSKKKMMSHAKQYSQGYRSDLNKGTQYTFWSKNFDDMANKTMLRQLISKWGIMSIEMQEAYEKDMAAIMGEEEKPLYVDTAEDDLQPPAVEIPQNVEEKTDDAAVTAPVNKSTTPSGDDFFSGSSI